MAKFIDATLTVFVSVATAALVAVVVFPAHARGGASDRVAVPGIRHAVLVERLAPPPGPESAESTCPALTRPGSSESCPYVGGAASQGDRVQRSVQEINAETVSACPYLSTLAVRAGCPATTTRTESPACPFLSGKDHRDASPWMTDDHEVPLGLSL